MERWLLRRTSRFGSVRLGWLSMFFERREVVATVERLERRGWLRRHGDVVRQTALGEHAALRVLSA